MNLLDIMYQKLRASVDIDTAEAVSAVLVVIYNEYYREEFKKEDAISLVKKRLKGKKRLDEWLRKYIKRASRDIEQIFKELENHGIIKSAKDGEYIIADEHVVTGLEINHGFLLDHPDLVERVMRWFMGTRIKISWGDAEYARQIELIRRKDPKLAKEYEKKIGNLRYFKTKMMNLKKKGKDKMLHPCYWIIKKKGFKRTYTHRIEPAQFKIDKPEFEGVREEFE